MGISAVEKWGRVSAAMGVAAVSAVLAAGCAGVLPEPDPAPIVAEKAQARWTALIDGDLKKAYGFVSPTSRQTYTWEVYRGAVRPGFWKTAKVDKVACPAKDLCEVDLTIEYAQRGTVIRTPLRESWTKQDGEWWFVLKTL